MSDEESDDNTSSDSSSDSVDDTKKRRRKEKERSRNIPDVLGVSDNSTLTGSSEVVYLNFNMFSCCFVQF